MSKMAWHSKKIQQKHDSLHHNGKTCALKSLKNHTYVHTTSMFSQFQMSILTNKCKTFEEIQLNAKILPKRQCKPPLSFHSDVLAREPSRWSLNDWRARRERSLPPGIQWREREREREIERDPI